MDTKEGDAKTCNTVWYKIFIRRILMNGYLEKFDKQYFDKPCTYVTAPTQILVMEIIKVNFGG